MKKIDIEKLERKNIYSVPENFFENMQRKVLESVSEEPQIEVKRGKMIPLFWKYAAAAMVIVGGWGIFMMNDQEASNTAKSVMIQDADSSYFQAIAKQESSVKQDAVTPLVQQNDQRKDHSNNELVQESISPRKSIADDDVKLNATKSAAKSKKARTSFDDQANALVASYSSAEIAKLSTEAEHDVYLDVFY